MIRQSKVEILPTDRRKPEGSFYISWIVLSTLCIPIAYVFTIIILKIITDMVGDFVYVNGVNHITEDYLFMYVFVPIVSLLTGVMQYGLLRRFLPRMGWWVLATFAGWLLGFLLIALPSRLRWIDPPLMNLDLILIIMGFAIGVTQWLVLRRTLTRAGWWIVANILGWVLLGWIIPGNSLSQSGLILLGLLPACATAVILVVLMNRVPSTEPRL